MATEADVRRIALSLPGAYEHASYNNTPSFRTKPRMFATVRDEGSIAVVWVADEDEKRALIASDSDRFTTTPHYDGHPIVLVRLGAVQADELRELVTESWRLRAPGADVREWDDGH